jgi:hypothetical protein
LGRSICNISKSIERDAATTGLISGGPRDAIADWHESEGSRTSGENPTIRHGGDQILRGPAKESGDPEDHRSAPRLRGIDRQQLSATCRARSPDEFIAKIGVAAEEADESKGWLELLVTSNQVRLEDARDLIRESNELIAIFVASRKTAQRHKEERERLQRESRGRNRRRRPE